jgi:hypothetical protein
VGQWQPVEGMKVEGYSHEHRLVDGFEAMIKEA